MWLVIVNLLHCEVHVSFRRDEHDPGLCIIGFHKEAQDRETTTTSSLSHRGKVEYPLDDDGELRYRIENEVGVILTPGTMPDGRKCWAVTDLIS